MHCRFRNKEFIYRGLAYEKIQDFTQRLAREFPEARISTKLATSSLDELRWNKSSLSVLTREFLKDRISTKLATRSLDELR